MLDFAGSRKACSAIRARFVIGEADILRLLHGIDNVTNGKYDDWLVLVELLLMLQATHLMVDRECAGARQRMRLLAMQFGRIDYGDAN
jgi:hypothetical protein